MVAVNVSTQVPPVIQTVESLHAWSGALLCQVLSTRMLEESENNSQFQFTPQAFKAMDGREYYQLRCGLQLATNHSALSGKIWQKIVPSIDAAIPLDFLP